MKRILTASLFGLSLATSGLAHAEPVKIGVITTLSGGGAGLGIDMRDAFQLAIKQSGNKDIELVVEDDAQKPELAVQIAENRAHGSEVTDAELRDLAEKLPEKAKDLEKRADELEARSRRPAT